MNIKIAGIYGCSSPRNGIYQYWSMAIGKHHGFRRIFFSTCSSHGRRFGDYVGENKELWWAYDGAIAVDLEFQSLLWMGNGMGICTLIRWYLAFLAGQYVHKNRKRFFGTRFFCLFCLQETRIHRPFMGSLNGQKPENQPRIHFLWMDIADFIPSGNLT